VRVGFELLPEVCHVDAQVVGVPLGVGAPEFAQDLPVGDYLAAVLHEQLEKRVFLGGQVHFGPGAAHDARGLVEFDVTDAVKRDAPNALAVEVFCCALRTAYPPRPKNAGTSNERNKRERFRIVKSP